MFRALSAVMAILFGLGAVVQWNDPDPLRWMAIYAVACVLTAMTARSQPPHAAAVLTVAVIALIWGASIMIDVRADALYLHMFDEWEMKSVAVEEAREATGLLIVAAWLLVMADVTRRSLHRG